MAVTHHWVTFGGLERAAASPQPVDDLGDAARAAEVGTESRQAVINDVRMRVIEARQHGPAVEVDHAGPRPTQGHDLGSADGSHPTAGDRKVRVSREAGPPESADAATGKDQFSPHRDTKVRKWQSRGCRKMVCITGTAASGSAPCPPTAVRAGTDMRGCRWHRWRRWRCPPTPSTSNPRQGAFRRRRPGPCSTPSPPGTRL